LPQQEFSVSTGKKNHDPHEQDDLALISGIIPEKLA
jgi:hypothetical protein